VRITSKGQVTIPKAVRDKLGIGPGSNVGFEEEGGQIVLVPESKEEARAAAEHMIRHLQEFGRKAKRIPMTSEELMELTRGPFNDLDAD
jgi:AbrB family looped-hinge helix DNA binding protein